MNFYKKVEKEFTKRGYGLRQFCELADVNHSSFSRAKRENTEPQARTVKKICDFLGVPTDYFDDDNESSKNSLLVPV